MPDDPRVQEVLDRLLDSDSTPEEACRECPELLPVVSDRWRQIRRTSEELDALFPPDDTSHSEQEDARILPLVPGYDIEAELGRGGMGVVYRARHLRLNRVVALKMVAAGEFAGPRERARFQREAEAVAALRHPNIVQVYDVGDTGGSPFYTMEFINAGTLAQKLSGTPFPARDAAALVATLSGAVEAAHQAGIIHRDLKPANVLLTADDMPKVGDFGLARRVTDDAGLTGTGTAVGTPRYMAPEQARGQAGAADPAADVYSLGAILYELITGRPPFTGETAADTVHQLLTQDPVPPRRLNGRVPRDLETICLTCLRKEPRLRYGSAAALRSDLDGFLRGEPVAARPERLLARLARRARRRPFLSAAVAAAVLSTAALVGVWTWTLSERAAAARAEEATDRAADADLMEMVRLFRTSAWGEAKAAWERANGRLGNSHSATLRRRLEQGKRDLEVVADFERIRLTPSGVQDNHSTKPYSHEATCAAGFRKYGIDVEALAPAAAAAAVRASDVRDVLVEFLHEWLYWVSAERRPRVQAVVDMADDDGWRREYRTAIAAGDRDPARLLALAKLPATADQPPAILSGLCGGLLIHGHRAAALEVLLGAHRRHSGDFWINYLLGHFWAKERPPHAVGYFRVAVVLRPSSDQAYLGLARTLRDAGETEEARAAFGTALDLNTTTDLIKEWAKLLAPAGRLNEARAVWQRHLETTPRNPDAWYGYAQLCLFLGDEPGYRRACDALFEQFETTSDGVVAERTSLAGLLRPADGQVRRACTLADRAVAVSAEKDSPYLQFLSGLADYRLGRYDRAVAVLGAAASKLPDRPGPRLVLAMAQFRTGAQAEAKRTLAAAVAAYDWRPSRADHTTAWISHSLLRESEAVILPESATFLKGEFQPRDNDERLILLAACLCANQPLTAARLYDDAFRADPNLAENIQSGNRSSAARYATLAGRGQGADASGVAELERAKWRAQARKWLRADLASLSGFMERDSEAARALGLKRLTEWKEDSDFAGIRELPELSKLSQDERLDCRALWGEVEIALDRYKR